MTENSSTTTTGPTEVGTTGTTRVIGAHRRPHVVVVGGGFAGIQAMKALSKAEVDITLVDRHTYTAFQPLLYQVATAGLNPGDVTYFLRAARMSQRNVNFRQGELIKINDVSNTITLGDGAEMPYDYLVLATGATTNYFGTKGAAENSMAIYTRAQALALRDRIFTRLEHAAASAAGEDLAIVVVGAGPTGVEMAGALAELRNDSMASIYPELDPRRTHIVLVEMTGKVLGPFDEKLQKYAARALRERGVELQLNTSVAEVRPDGVLFGNGEFRRAGLVVWATGVTVPTAVAQWGLPQGRGSRITVDDDLRVVGHPNIFAAGDLSITPNPLPQLATPAQQQGKHIGRQITALVTARPIQPWSYRDKGTMATVGRRAAVCDIALSKNYSIKLTGTLAWLTWMLLHIVLLLGGRNRLAAFVNLFTKYLAPSRRTNPIVGDIPVFEHHAGRSA